MAGRTADPYRDTDVIDAHAPRANQAFVGLASLLALVLGLEWLVALVALQLTVGLAFGRRFCLPCVAYFELIQPRIGEGPIEDARPPRFANIVGVAFLGAATVAFVLGAATVGGALSAVVAALALLAAGTGLCVGCEMYRLSTRLRRVPRRRVERIDPAEVGPDGAGVVEFTHPLCAECREWQERLERDERPLAVVDVSRRPELARKYGVRIVPTVVSVGGDGSVLERLAP